MFTFVKMAMYLRAIVDKAGESDGEFHFSDVEVEMSTAKSVGLALGGLLADNWSAFRGCLMRAPQVAAQRG